MLQDAADATVKLNVAWIGVVGSMIAAAVALITAFINQRATRKNQRELVEHQLGMKALEAQFAEKLQSLKAELDEQKAEKDARRDYVYEARKRLYQECEPLLFQLYEMSIGGMKRIRSLARTARDGDLGPLKTSWLSNEEYYTLSTIYMLMSPLTIFKLIQQRLTLVDLTVDPHIKAQYLLAKNLYLSFTADFKLARQSPFLEYNPHLTERRDESPAVYWRQGLAVGRLDKAVSALLLCESNNTYRCMSFGEFETAYRNPELLVSQNFKEVTEIFLNFHPKSRPVLWRILITQLHLYKAIARVSESNDYKLQGEPFLLEHISEEDRKEFDWREKGDEVRDDEVLVEPFAVAESYLTEKLYLQFIPNVA